MPTWNGWAQEIGVLWGEQHPEYGATESLALDRRCAIALSAGRVPKPAPKIDPNEDAVLVVLGTDGYVLAVADGHNGCDAARGALIGIAGAAAGAPLDAATRPERFIKHLFAAAVDGVAETLQGAEPARARSRTALTVALVARGRLTFGTAGDTAAAQVGRRSWRRAVTTGPYLGPRGSPPRIRRQRLHHQFPVVVASDGLTDFMRDDWRDGAGDVIAHEKQPESAARALVQAACAAGAGDNVAVAVLFGPHAELPRQPVLGFRNVASSEGLRLVTRPPVGVSGAYRSPENPGHPAAAKFQG